jgi:hypothetical protein
MLVAFLLELQFFLSRPDAATRARNWRRHAFGFCLFAIILIANYAINTRANAAFSSKFDSGDAPRTAQRPPRCIYLPEQNTRARKSRQELRWVGVTLCLQRYSPL